MRYHSAMSSLRLTSERLVLAFLVLAVVWKGGKALDAVWLLALVSGSVALFAARKRGVSVPLLFFVALLLLLVWTVLSFVFSTTLNYGFDEVLQAASLTLLLLWAAARRQEDERFAGRFAQTLSLAGISACGIGVFVYILQPVSRFVGTFFDRRFHTDYWPNAWAEFLLLLWPLLLWAVFSRDEKKLPKVLQRDFTKGAVLGLVLACMMLSYSRGGIIAFAGQFVLMLVLIVVSQRQNVQWKRIPVVAVSVAVFSVIFFTGINSVRQRFHVVQSVVAKATFSSDEGMSSVSERQAFWRQSTELAQKKPLFGWGPYSFRFLQTHIQDGVLQTSDHPHNVFLKYASERGIAAAALLFVILTWAMAAGIRSSFRRSSAIPLDLFLMIAVAGVVAHNLIDYNLQFVGIALPLWLSIGLLVSRAPRKAPFLMSYRLLALVGFSLLLFAVYEGANLAMSSRARRAEAQGNPIQALTWYALTDKSLFPRDAWLARGVMLLALNQLPQAEEAVDRSLGYNDQDARAWRLLGDIYLRWNKRQDALRAYEKAYAYGKYNDIGITRGLIYLLRDQDMEELTERRHEFDMLLNEFGLAIEQNTHFIALGRNVEDVVSLCDLLAETFPEDADAYRQLALRSQTNANEERAKTASRPRGLLW